MKAVLAQLSSVVILSILSSIGGVAVTWPSYATELLASDSSPLGVKASTADVSMITSCIMVGAMVASLGAGYLADAVGRKNAEVLAGVLVTLSWALIATAKNITQILIGRVILGVGFGFHLPVGYVIVNEISQPSIRGSMAAALVFSCSVGSIVSYLTGWFCSYDVINYIYLSLSVVFVVMIYFVRESPVYLLSRGKEKEALDSLKYYRGTSQTTPEILDELNYFMKQLKNKGRFPESADLLKTEQTEKEKLKEESSVPVSDENKMGAFRMLIYSKPSRRAFLTISTQQVVGIFTGSLVVQSYAARFFTEAVPSLSPHLCSVILAVAITVGCLLSLTVTDLVGRRTLMLSSAAICATCLGALSALLHYRWGPAWLTPALILGYCCIYQLGINNVPVVQMSESFIPEVRSTASAICMTSMCLTNFINLALFAPTVEYLGLDGTFFFFFIICVIFNVLVFFTTKETKGVPVEDIQEMYERGWFYWN